MDFSATSYKLLKCVFSSRALLFQCSTAVLLFCCSYVDVFSQPGCIVGDRIQRNVRIQDVGNACNHCTNYAPNVLLHLLSSTQPTLKLTHNGYLINGVAPECPNGIDGTLSLYTGVMQYSTLEGVGGGLYDLSLVARPTAGNLILSTRNYQKNIILATTPTQNGNDVERIKITPEGQTGIWQSSPKELLHIGSKMTFHIGYENDYLGYNVYRDGNDDKLIVGTSSPNQGYALKYGMSRHGYLEIGAGSTSTGLANAVVDWYEGGGLFSDFAGLTIKQNDGKGCASFGRYYPSATTRLLVKAFSLGETETDAIVAISSTEEELFRVRNNGRVGVHQAAPKERFQIGDLITFHDGGGKFMGFNAFYDGSVMKNIEGGRASVIMGIGAGSPSPDVFEIKVDEQGTPPATIFSSFKGMVINTNGDMGVGVQSPDSRLEIKSGGSTSSTNALKIKNSSNTSLVVVQDNGAVEISNLAGTGNRAVYVNSAGVLIDGSGVSPSTWTLSGNTGTSSSTNFIGTTDNQGLVIKTNNAKRMEVTNSGVVKIGTTSPTGSNPNLLLSVSGDIFCKELLVTTAPGSWADYVLREDYELMSLEQVENYIADHGTLPDVPAEAEVIAQGVPVGDMVGILLKKVEELTLHMIAMDKRNVELQKQIDQCGNNNK